MFELNGRFAYFIFGLLGVFNLLLPLVFFFGEAAFWLSLAFLPLSLKYLAPAAISFSIVRQIGGIDTNLLILASATMIYAVLAWLQLLSLVPWESPKELLFHFAYALIMLAFCARHFVSARTTAHTIGPLEE